MSNSMTLENAASAWAGWVLPMAWQLLVLTAVIWIVTRLMHRRSAALRYMVWALVFVKLVVPPWIGAPWSAATLAQSSVPEAAQVLGERGELPYALNLAQSSTLPMTSQSEQIVFSELSQPLAEASVSMAPSMLALAFLAWATVAALLMLVVVTKYVRYARRVMKDAAPLPSQAIAIATTQAKYLGLRKMPQLLSSPHVESPVAFGMLRPVVLLPHTTTKDLSDSQLSHLIGHELAHIKRRDIPLGWLTTTLLCLYWFHPAVWFANVFLRKEREMACDDEVLAATREAGQTYAATIMRVAELFSGRAPTVVGFLGVHDMTENLIQRVRSIVDTARPRKAGWRSFVTIAALVLLVIPMGVWPKTTAAVDETTAAVDQEIEASYAAASDEQESFIRWTAGRFAKEGYWLPSNAFDDLTAEAREAKVEACITALDGTYGPSQWKPLAEAGVLGDARLLPGLTKVAWFMRDGGQDNRAKWLAVLALGRLDEPDAIPTLIPLVDHYNKNTRIWAQASLARLAGENFGGDKEAWSDWARKENPEYALPSTVLEWASQQSETRMAARRSKTPPATGAISDLSAKVEQEISAHYSTAGPEEKEYIRWTAKTFGRSGLWLPHDSFANLSQTELNENVEYAVTVLDGEYGRHLCSVLASAGALKDKRLLPGLVKAAAYHRDDTDYDCRPKWMAVAALGRQDDASAVPTLVPLVDHGNLNTRTWARASLSRLTGENFGDDKQAWARWWNDAGNEPQIDVSSLKAWKAPGAKTQVAQQTQAATTSPKVISTSPAIGAENVDASTKEIRVTFDQDMSAGGYSWTGGGDRVPEITGKPEWVDKRTCKLPVTLIKGKFYRIGINSSGNRNFKGANGRPAELNVIYFATEAASDEVVAMLEVPKLVSIVPANGATDVSASTTQLTAVFDRPMGSGFSWTKAGGTFPPTSGRPTWEDDGKTCHLPVNLEAGATYRLGLNHPYANNFQSAAGVPLKPMVLEFSTTKK